MKATENRMVDLTSINPANAEAYLRARDWTREGDFRGIESYWTSATGHDLVLPLRPDLEDFALRMSEVLESLAEAEERSQREVIGDLQTAGMDVVSLRVMSEGAVDGSIPLSGGVELVENARLMLVSVARAAVERRAHFLGGAPREVSRYLNRVQLGQTERGSYVVNLLSPIAVPPDQRPGDDNQLFDDRKYEGELHFPRSVTAMLNKALRSAQEATEKSKNDPTYRPFVNAVQSGVSANLCEALVKINESGGERGMHIDLRWAYTRPEPGQQRETYEFDSASVPVMREAAVILRETDPYDNYLLIGRVIGLHRDRLIDTGRVTIKADVEETSRQVLVDLGGNDYSEAVAAHDSGAVVRVQGRLRNKNARWYLEAPRRFAVLEDRPLPSSDE